MMFSRAKVPINFAQEKPFNVDASAANTRRKHLQGCASFIETCLEGKFFDSSVSNSSDYFIYQISFVRLGIKYLWVK